MDTVKLNATGVKIIAHRGLSGIERENTNAAFVAAANRSYYGIETDVHVTRDGKFVLLHDETTGRVAKKNINVERSKLKKILKIVLNNKEDKTGRNDLRIPLLSEYISICKNYGKVCVVELKGRMSEKSIRGIIEEIRDMNYLEKVVFISFDKRNLINVRNILPDCPAQLLTAEYDRKVFETINENKFGLDIYYKVLNKEIIDEVHGAGLEVNCWTCDDKEAALRLIEYGVDYITTNILE